jgi:hypothetical protein
MRDISMCRQMRYLGACDLRKLGEDMVQDADGSVCLVALRVQQLFARQNECVPL